MKLWENYVCYEMVLSCKIILVKNQTGVSDDSFWLVSDKTGRGFMGVDWEWIYRCECCFKNAEAKSVVLKVEASI